MLFIDFGGDSARKRQERCEQSRESVVLVALRNYAPANVDVTIHSICVRSDDDVGRLSLLTRVVPGGVPCGDRMEN